MCWGGGGLKAESGKFHEILTGVCGGSKTFLYPSKKLLVCVWGSKNFYTPPKLLVCVWGGLKTESSKFHEILTSVCGGSKTFLYPSKKLLVCVWGSKNFLYPPKIVSVCVGGLKTESSKFHEILTSVCGGSKTFLYPPEKLLVCVGGSKNWNWQIFATFSKLQVE